MNRVSTTSTEASEYIYINSVFHKSEVGRTLLSLFQSVIKCRLFRCRLRLKWISIVLFNCIKSTSFPTLLAGVRKSCAVVREKHFLRISSNDILLLPGPRFLYIFPYRLSYNRLDLGGWIGCDLCIPFCVIL